MFRVILQSLKKCYAKVCSDPLKHKKTSVFLRPWKKVWKIFSAYANIGALEKRITPK